MVRTPEEIRAEAVSALMAPGEERRRLLARVTEIDETLRPLIRNAVEAGVPQPRIVEITGVARNTIRAWSRTATE